VVAPADPVRHIIDGTATRAVLDGAPYYRTFTP